MKETHIAWVWCFKVKKFEGLVFPSFIEASHEQRELILLLPCRSYTWTTFVVGLHSLLHQPFAPIRLSSLSLWSHRQCFRSLFTSVCATKSQHQSHKTKANSLNARNKGDWWKQSLGLIPRKRFSKSGFITSMEASGLSVNGSEWCMYKHCTRRRRWNMLNIMRPTTRPFINFS